MSQKSGSLVLKHDALLKESCCRCRADFRQFLNESCKLTISLVSFLLALSFAILSLQSNFFPCHRVYPIAYSHLHHSGTGLIFLDHIPGFYTIQLLLCLPIVHRSIKLYCLFCVLHHSWYTKYSRLPAKPSS